MKTTLYLIRHDAGENPSTDLLHVQHRQEELTRDFLAVQPIDHCYCSPHRAVIDTALVLTSPHGLKPQPMDDLAPPGLDESPHQFQNRIGRTLDGLMREHPGLSLLVVAQNPIPRYYLTSLLGLGRERGEQLHLNHCGISVVIQRDTRSIVQTVNASFHLQGLGSFA